MKRRLLVCFAFIIALASSCKKVESYDPVAQLAADELLIKEFIAANNIEDMRRDSTGVYYSISDPGAEKPEYKGSTLITATYAGRLLNGRDFDAGTIKEYPLGGLIAGWQIGIPKIGKGGKIRLLIPSVYAYGPQASGGIPANSVLDFTITLDDHKESSSN